MRTSELIGPALDWAVAKCEGLTLHKNALLNGLLMEGWWASGYYADPNLWIRLGMLRYSTDHGQGGPIIERERIGTWPSASVNGQWAARPYFEDRYERGAAMYGPTKLIAAMRCYVASRMGDEVDVPEELLDKT